MNQCAENHAKMSHDQDKYNSLDTEIGKQIEFFHADVFLTGQPIKNTGKFQSKKKK